MGGVTKKQQAHLVRRPDLSVYTDKAYSTLIGLLGLCGLVMTAGMWHLNIANDVVIFRSLITSSIAVCFSAPIFFLAAGRRVLTIVSSLLICLSLFYSAYIYGVVLSCSTLFLIPVVFAITLSIGSRAGAALTAATISLMMYLWWTAHKGSGPVDIGGSQINIDIILAVMVSMTISLFLSAAVLRQMAARAIKELKKAQDQAQASEKAKSAFLANMSHEIRTPTNGIIGLLDVCLQSDLSGEQRQQLTTARSAAGALVRLLNDILDHERMQSGKVDVIPEPTSPRQLILNSVGLFEAAAREKSIGLDTIGLKDLPRSLMLDQARVGQILTNLIANAVKFTDRGVVTVSASHDNGEFSVSVVDTGKGINPEFLPHLFNRFSQAEVTIRNGSGGTGLGLAICQQLAALMGGSVSVESKLGYGSRFVLSIPAEKTENGDASSVEEQKVENAPDAEKRELYVLVTEDNEVNRQVTEAYLKRMGHRSISAKDGEEALETVAVENFDVILMDVAMPNMDGIEATRRIKAMRGRKAKTPIIMLTAHVEESYLAACREAGAVSVLHKPLTPVMLKSALDELFRPEPKASKQKSKRAEAV